LSRGSTDRANGALGLKGVIKRPMLQLLFFFEFFAFLEG